MEKEQKFLLYRLIAATLLFVAALLLPFDGIWRLFAFLIPYLIVGCDVLWSAIRNVLHGEVFDEEFLMTVASAGAFAIGEYPEAVAVMLLFRVGELFEDVAVEKSRKNITALMDIRPDTATVIRDSVETVVSPQDVAVGETVVIRPGERVPLDGCITRGETTVDTAALTGESIPQSLCVGDRILSGSVNLTGMLEIRTDRAFTESTVAKILSLVENAAEKKSHAEKFITKFAKVYTPCVVFAAVALAVIPPLFGAGWLEWLRRALIFLVVSCPCALVISVPLTFFAGIGGASRKGILIKGAEYLERLKNVDTIVFDKTGTLTQGVFSVTSVLPVDVSEKELLKIAALAEAHSSHPIAQSILSACAEKPDLSRIGEVRELSGRGICAEIDGKTYYVGNGRLMAEASADFTETDGTAVYISENSHFLGTILLSDRPKEGADKAVSALQSLGVSHTVMLTGDRAQIAKEVAERLHIETYFTDLLPSDKVEKLEALLSDGNTVAFVGDGINDAPVLMRADLGIAMGGCGSDAAIEAADVVLMDDNLSKLPAAVRIARKTLRIIRENIIFALAVKLAILLCSALGLFGVAGTWIAVFADVGVMVLAVLNALRAFYVKP